MFETILLPTDGSTGTAAAADQALQLAEEHGGSLHVLHVLNTSDLPLDGHSQSLLQSLEDRAEASVTEIVDRAEARGIAPARGAVREGTPHREILDYVDENDVDLVVMGTHGHSRLDQFLLGSVTDRVVRNARVPVLTVRLSSPEDS